MIVLFAFDLAMVAAVCKVMREKKSKVRYVDAAQFSGEKEDGDMVFLHDAEHAAHPKADELKAMPRMLVVEVTKDAEAMKVAKAVAMAIAQADADAAKAGAEPAPAPAKQGKPGKSAAPPPDPGESKAKE